MGVGHIFQESILYIIFADSRGAHCVITIHTCSLLVILKQLKIEFLF